MAKVAVRHDRIASNSSASRLRTKKRTSDVSKSVVSALILVLVGQAGAALYFSPIFAVSPATVSVQASPLCTESEIQRLIQPDLPRSIMRLPTSRWSDALENITVVKSALITTRFPNRLTIVVKDRQPQLVCNLDGLGPHVLDADLVPFRSVVDGDDRLPVLSLQSNIDTPELGVCVADKAQVMGIQIILNWLTNHPKVAVSSLNIQNKHLAFVIKSSNVNVLLGTPRRLEEKLDSLEVLIDKRPDLLTSRKYSAVNLFSDEYPALVTRSNSVEKSAVP
jgi:hypothetical protein